MFPEIYDELLSKLIKRTMRGEVHWRLSSQGDMFIVNLNKYCLCINRGSDYINFIISDNNNKGIDEFRITNTDREWDKISAFYNQIRIKSPDIKNAIAAMIDELEAEGVVGSKETDSNSEGNKKIYKIIG
jgi:benzoyl-CoA reductase/2-hydroxyglutaryl-CoA dehydratase subunit BcrC/BadD/HgdB